MQSDCKVGFVSALPVSSAYNTRKILVSQKILRSKRLVSAKRYGCLCTKMVSGEEWNTIGRRQILKSLILTSAATVSTVMGKKAGAFTAGDAHARLSDFVAKLPGAGMPDIYFPEYFLGTWSVSRRLLNVNPTEEFASIARPDHLLLSQKGLEVLQEAIGTDITLRARFVTHRGHVIQDRAYDALEEISTLLAAQSLAQKKDSELPPAFNTSMMEADWDPDNANVLSLSWGNFGETRRVREVKVTKRAFKDQPQGVGTFVASEYARVVDVEGEGALLGAGKPPSNYARRRVSRFTVASVAEDLSPDRLYRLVVDYIFAPNVLDEKTVVTLKFKDILSRIS